MVRAKVYIPQSEAEWVQTGQFEIGFVQIFDKSIRYACTKVPNPKKVVTMVGGIPREVSRRENLPLINKLYGLLALELATCGIKSILYNQPATGQSSGDWNQETLHSRALVLRGLLQHFNQTGVSHTVIGTSAGAYIALLSLESPMGVTVDQLVMMSPAAYPKEAEHVPYGPAFTEILRSGWRIPDSPTFTRLEGFVRRGGELFLSFFENDDPPIPRPIQHHFGTIAEQLQTSGRAVHRHIIPGVAHNFRKITVGKDGNLVDNASIARSVGMFRDFIT